LSLINPSARAAQWFLRSGIQEPAGGVARYYREDLQRNSAVSTEITGYALCTFLFAHACTGERDYLCRAQAAARFLANAVGRDRVLPFEIGSCDGDFSYFFDCGIVVRSLVAAWHVLREPGLLETATALGHAMAADFSASDGGYNPILMLPEKQPLAYDSLRWSRTPGCYQLKAALAWRELFEATGDARFDALYEGALETALRGYGSFLPGHAEPAMVVDRLHAFLYFLEGLLPRAAEKRCAAALCHGIQTVAGYVAETATEFERSDVYAQLLRIRVYADWAGAVPLHVPAARREADTLGTFQIASADPRTEGGFYFGRQGAQWRPHVNPVSAAFAMQALALWDRHQNGREPVDARLLI